MKRLVYAACMLLATASLSQAYAQAPYPGPVIQHPAVGSPKHPMWTDSVTVRANEARSMRSIPSAAKEEPRGATRDLASLVWAGLKGAGRGVAWPVKNWRTSTHVAANIAGYAIGGPAGMGVTAATSTLLQATRGDGKPSFKAPQVAQQRRGNAVTRVQVEQAAPGSTKGRPRYSVPGGEVKTISNSIFMQPRYNGKPEMLQGWPRRTAKELGLVGTIVTNEFTENLAVEVALTEDAILILHPETGEPLYLADCVMDGRPWVNRIRVPRPARAEQSAQQAAPSAQTQPTVTMPAIPQPFQLRLDGLPAPVPLVPGTMTINVNHTYRDETKTPWSKHVWNTVLPAAAMVGAINFPDAMRDVARTNARGAVDVANITADWQRYAADQNAWGLVEAAKNRVPDQVNVIQANKQDQDNYNTAHGGAGGSSYSTSNAVNTNTNTNSSVSNASPTVNTTANGGEGGKGYGGEGGQGGQGGQGGTGYGGHGYGGQGGQGGTGNGGNVTNSGNNSSNSGGNTLNNSANNGNTNNLNNGNSINNSDKTVNTTTSNGGHVSGSGNSTNTNTATGNGGQATANGGNSEVIVPIHSHPPTLPCTSYCPARPR